MLDFLSKFNLSDAWLFGIIGIVVRILLSTVACALLYLRTLQNHNINDNWLCHKCVKVSRKFHTHVLTELRWIFWRNSDGILIEFRHKIHLRWNSVTSAVRILDTDGVLGHNIGEPDPCHLKLWPTSVKICDGLRHKISVTNTQILHSGTVELHSCDGLFRHSVCYSPRHKPDDSVAIFSVTNCCDGRISVTIVTSPSQWNLWLMKFQWMK